MKNRGILAFCAALIVLASGFVAARGASDDKAQAQPAATFSSRTQLVLVPAIVSDRSGTHVANLTKDDFIVLENGVEQKVSVFEEVRPTTAPVPRLKAETASPREFTNTRPANFQPRRVNIIVLDAINTAFLDQTRARADIIKYLSNSVSENELTTLLLFSRGGIRVIHDFTTDPSVLVRALQHVKGHADMMSGENAGAPYTDPLAGSGTDAQAVQSEQQRLEDFMEHMEARSARMQQDFAIEATLDAFRGIAQTYSGIPGRKALIWVTGSFPFTVPKPGDDPSNRDFTGEFQRVFDQLNAANVALYPIDARGLVTVGFGAADRVPASAMRRGGAGLANAQRSLMERHLDTIATMTTFADLTGGRAFYNTNDLARALQRADQDSSAYYLLGYYVKSSEGKPGWRKLQVKLKQQHGISIRARTGYYFTQDTETNNEVVRRREMAGAVNSPFDFTAVPLWVDWAGQKPAANGKKAVEFTIVVGSNTVTVDTADQNHLSVEFLAVARDPAMKQAGQSDQTVEAHLRPENLEKMHTSGLSYQNRLEVPPGEYTVKFVVRDNLSGRVGSVSAPLTVE